MELLEWNQQTCVQQKTPNYFVCIKPSAGKINFSQDLAVDLGLEKNRVIFSQDKNTPKDWYLKVVPDNNEKGFAIRYGKSVKGKKVTAMFQNIFLANKVIESIGVTGAIKCLVALEPISQGTYAIITKSAKTISRGKHAKK